MFERLTRTSVATIFRKEAPKPSAEPIERVTVIYCPRCERPYKRKQGEKYSATMRRVIDHVAQQHPDHDPEWWDTYPSYGD